MKEKTSSKRPFYKQIWFWIIIVVAFTGLLGAVFMAGKNSNESTSHTKTDQKSYDSSTESSNLVTDDYGDQTSKDNITLQKIYYKINVGDLMKDGKGGSTYTYVKKSLQSGPSETSSNEISGVETKVAKWEYDDMTLNFTFVNNRVVKSSITDFRWERPENRITLKAYKKLSDKTSPDSVTKKFGLPDEVEQSQTLGIYKTIYSWYTGIQGSEGSSLDLEFTGTLLTNKSETGLS
ncbi:DUF3862 domain-containing protein [Lactobacillus sp. ESL0684]|uniref:DUF3862 domain-containing protein n=1 Tax=Lactobacillus sp. ESL0684 TaxID=2983213 RepID=UPI0023F84CE9|nr:DUF3862 domain-containing protein [Lactobacillus sp. ESL0684]WEV43006.1 DUF3862 domain-containing protein [Lactobacillus sp. ESL0684]